MEPIENEDVECEVLSAYEPNYWFVRLKHGPDDAYFDTVKVHDMLEKMNCWYMEQNPRNQKNRHLHTIYEDSEDFGFEYTHSSLNFKLQDLVVFNEKVENGTWKRGKIIQINDHQSKADVLLLDEGKIKFGVPVEELKGLVEEFKILRSDIYCVYLASVNDVNLRTVPLDTSPIQKVVDDEDLFNIQCFLRFSQLKEYEGHDIVDVLRLPEFLPYPATIILRGHKRSGDPFAPPLDNIFQKDVSKYLISKGLATVACQWEDRNDC